MKLVFLTLVKELFPNARYETVEHYRKMSIKYNLPFYYCFGGVTYQNMPTNLHKLISKINNS
jgi:hypothetical protein